MACVGFLSKHTHAGDKHQSSDNTVIMSNAIHRSDDLKSKPCLNQKIMKKNTGIKYKHFMATGKQF
ncbi:hypothetical protein A1OW_17615 [Enterovibrio norvegicus]|nr:hypothetical protein A1OW_17615 [Enterovibrio norvegicus]